MQIYCGLIFLLVTVPILWDYLTSRPWPGDKIILTY